MSCPMFIDYTRNCINKYPNITKIAHFDFCTSDDYENCPVYGMIEYPEKRCKYSVDCYIHFDTINENISWERIKELSLQYCFNEENRENCALYKLYNKEKEIPPYLLADGTKVELKRETEIKG